MVSIYTPVRETPDQFLIYGRCTKCTGTGREVRRCCEMGKDLVAVKHELNSEYLPSEGFRVYQCKNCLTLWGYRHQFHPGTGSDNMLAPLDPKKPKAFYHHGSKEYNYQGELKPAKEMLEHATP